MCGIVGYVGSKPAQEILLDGLRRLEYRGYDSSGTSFQCPAGQIKTTRAVGRIVNLAEKLAAEPTSSTSGIGHTRWATHGTPVEENAQPHPGGNDILSLVHNGVIENYQDIKGRLETAGYEFKSATDSEVIAHLVADCLAIEIEKHGPASDESPYSRLLAAVKCAIAQLRGTYGIVVLFTDYPNVLITAKLGSPIVIGVGNGEHFVASDSSPLLGQTDKIVYLSDHQVALITPDSIQVSHRDLGHIQPNYETLEGTSVDVDKAGYDHFMLKEIFEQPESLVNVMRGRLNDDDATAVFGGLNLSPHDLRRVRRIVLTACGTSWHSALVGEYLFEELAHIPVEVEYASELRYRNSPMDERTILFAITQSGETADTLAALREMKRKGHLTMAICNVVGSSIAQEADGGIYLHAGPEIGVASTKAYTSQCMSLAMLALYFGRMRHISYSAGRRIIDRLRELPDRIGEALKTNDECRRIAEKYKSFNNFLYLGRHYNFPTALEGALKLKEISYCHAEGYPAAEMKTLVPLLLVDENTPSVFSDASWICLRQSNVKPGRDQSSRRPRHRHRR